MEKFDYIWRRIRIEKVLKGYAHKDGEEITWWPWAVVWQTKCSWMRRGIFAFLISMAENQALCTRRKELMF